MKSLFILTSALLFTTNVLAENDPLWMRYPAISPNGETIAFTYKGDIYTVPANGGKATQLTTHPAHDTRPVWSPDGSKIVFASDRNGNFDIYNNGAALTGVTNTATVTYSADKTTLIFERPNGLRTIFSILKEPFCL